MDYDVSSASVIDFIVHEQTEELEISGQIYPFERSVSLHGNTNGGVNEF